MIHPYSSVGLGGGGGARKLIHKYEGKIFRATQARNNNVLVDDFEGLVVGDRILTRAGERTISSISSGGRIGWNQDVPGSRDRDRYLKSVILDNDETHQVNLGAAKDLFIFGNAGYALPVGLATSASDAGVRIATSFTQAVVVIDGTKMTASAMSFAVGGYSWIYGVEQDNRANILPGSSIYFDMDSSGLVTPVRDTSSTTLLPFLYDLYILGA